MVDSKPYLLVMANKANCRTARATPGLLQNSLSQHNFVSHNLPPESLICSHAYTVGDRKLFYYFVSLISRGVSTLLFSLSCLYTASYAEPYKQFCSHLYLQCARPCPCSSHLWLGAWLWFPSIAAPCHPGSWLSWLLAPLASSHGTQQAPGLQAQPH